MRPGARCCSALVAGVAGAQVRPGAAPAPEAQRSLGDSSSLSSGGHLCVIVGGGSVVCSDDSSWRMDRAALRELAKRQSGAVPIGKPVRWKQVRGLKDLTALSSGRYGFVCGLSRSGKVWCWGEEPLEEPKERLFRTATASEDVDAWDLPPAPLRGLTKRAVALAAGYGSVCVRLEDGSLQCTERSGLASPRAQPLRGPGQARCVVGREYGDCVLDPKGAVTCSYQAENSSGWRRGAGFSGPLERISLGGGGEYGQSIVAVTRTGRLEICELGQADRPCAPVVNAPADIVQLSGSCALTKAGEISCWDAHLFMESRAKKIPLPEPAVELSTGLGPQCARLASGKIACIEFVPPKGEPIPVAYLIEAPRLPLPSPAGSDDLSKR